MKHLKEIPDFKSEEEEFEFWATHDSTDYIDWTKSQEVTFPNLKPTDELLPLFLDTDITKDLKVLAKERSIDLAALAAQYIREGVRRDAQHATH
ncbi:MAG: CopG family antitoxin [Candidatus Micrarchaeaceae archaeon]